MHGRNVEVSINFVSVRDATCFLSVWMCQVQQATDADKVQLAMSTMETDMREDIKQILSAPKRSIALFVSAVALTEVLPMRRP